MKHISIGLSFSELVASRCVCIERLSRLLKLERTQSLFVVTTNPVRQIEITVFLDVLPYNLVNGYQRFEGTTCFHHQSRNQHDYWVFEVFPSSGVLRKIHNTFRKKGSISVLGRGVGDTYFLDPLERANLNHQKFSLASGF
jgi:hypothetical protein